MRRSNYTTLTDEELLAAVEEARAASPIIEALAVRLEGLGRSGKRAGFTVPCPVCEATLAVEGPIELDQDHITIGVLT